MPKVIVEYELPQEKKALEDAMMGADSTKLIESFRAWLVIEVATHGRAKLGSPDYHYKRGVEACAARFEGLLAAPAEGEQRATLDEEANEAEAQENVQ